MSKNIIQFQKGMSIADFMSKYGTESKCRKEVFNLRWPKGFICPECSNTTYCEIKARHVLQCHHCHNQTSVTSGTIFHSTKVSLVKWFFAMYFLTQSKNGISALELSRQLGISYNAAWRIKHKLMQIMLEQDNGKKLSGDIEIDDAYLGGENIGGKRGRGAEKKTPFVASVEENKDGNPIRIKFSKVIGFRKIELKRWSEHHLAYGSKVISDGLSCFFRSRRGRF